MADKVTSKRWTLLRTTTAILRWLWIGVLAILLVAGLIFHAPWKVIGLIAVFLLTCTALPRRQRKYFWATVGTTVLALTAWVFLPNDSRGWRPHVFEKETEAFLAKYRVPTEENAAVAYESLCRRWDADDPNEPNVPDDWYDRAKDGPWRGEEYPETAARLDYHKDTVARLMEAATLEGCFFEGHLHRQILGPPLVLPPFPAMRQLAFLLEAAANRDWAERGLATAIEKHLACLRMGAHLSGQPLELYQLVGYAVELLAFNSLNQAIVDDNMDAIGLEIITRSVAATRGDWRHSFEGILESDRLRMKNQFSQWMYQVNDAGRVRRTRDPWCALRSQIESAADSNEFADEQTLRDLRRAAYPSYWRQRVGRAWMIASWFVYPVSPRELSRIVDKAYERYTPMLDPGFKRQAEPQSVLSVIEASDWRRFMWNFACAIESTTAISEEGYDGFRQLFRRTETARRGTLVMVGLRRYKNDHGSWPQNLEAAQAYGKDLLLVDAWDRPFVYRLEGDGFVLYSIGANSLDESGQHDLDGPDDVPIWPLPRRASKPKPGDINDVS